MPDKIVTDVKIKNGDTTYVYMKDVYAEPILEAIESNMTTLGWNKVDIANNPRYTGDSGSNFHHHLFLQLLVRLVVWIWRLWGWYYPPYYSVSSYTTGTMIITMADPESG